MAKDPFTYLLGLRRRYVPDLLWFGLGAIVVGIGVLVEERGALAVLIGLALSLGGVFVVAVFVYRRLAGRSNFRGTRDNSPRRHD